MKKLKFFLSTFIASALSLSLLASCGSGTANNSTTTQAPATTTTTTTQAAATTTTQAPNTTAAANDPLMDPTGTLSPDKPITISLVTITSKPVPAADNKIAKLLKDKLGVTLTYDIVNSDSQDQKIGTLLAGGQYPDLIGTGDNQFRLLKGGAFIKLDDMLATGKYQNLVNHIQPVLKRVSWAGSDGVAPGVYIFPNYNRFYGQVQAGQYYGPGFFIQKRVLEDAGYPDLSNMTLDKYFSLIENYLAKNPETNGVKNIGFTMLDSAGHEWGLTNPPALLAGSPNNGGVIVDKNNVATIYADKDIAKTYFQKLNEEYAKGVVDPEAFSQTNDQYAAKIATGAVLGMHDQAWNFGSATDSLRAAGKDNMTYVALMPVYDGATPYYQDRAVMNLQQGYGISKSCKNPEVVLQFLNVMMSEAWQKVFEWGIQGEDYMVDANGMYYRTDQQRANAKDLTWKASNKLEAFYDQMAKYQGTFPDGNADSPDNQPSEFFASLTAYDQAFLKAYNKQTWCQFLNPAPDNPVYYPCWNIPLSDAANEANQQMTDTGTQYLPKAITDTTANFEANWQAYIDALHKIDIKTYEDEINAGIKQRIADWQ
ncbi:MAG: ABC transporter substrate-binding protein [Oscillospiraceae bacterium]|nr:ABC transporter substrate-binding protein [Oscillospiraceae bacterium]